VNNLLEEKKLLGPFLIIYAVLMLFFYAQWFNEDQINTNAQIRAIVDNRTTQVDEQVSKYGVSLDRADYNGHVYCDKAPGISFVGVPVYLVLKTIGNLFGFEYGLVLLHFLMRLVIVSIPTLLIIPLFLRRARKLSGLAEESDLVTIAFFQGSMVLLFANTFFAHQFVGVLLFLLYELIERSDKRTSSGKFFAAGALGAYAIISEYPAAISVGFLSFYLWKRVGSLRFLVPYLLGMLPFYLIHAVYAWVSFDDIFALGYHYTEGYRITIGSENAEAVNWPSFQSLYHTLLSPYRGLLFSAPVLIFGIIGITKTIRNKHENRFMSLAITFGGIILVHYFAINMLDDWAGGASSGDRHWVIVLPFFFLSVCLFLRNAAGLKNRIVGGIFSGLILYSILYYSLVVFVDIFFYPYIYNPVSSTLIPALALRGTPGPVISFASMVLSPESYIPLIIYLALSAMLPVIVFRQYVQNKVLASSPAFYRYAGPVMGVIAVFICLNVFHPERQEAKSTRFTAYHFWNLKDWDRTETLLIKAFEQETNSFTQVDDARGLMWFYVSKIKDHSKANSFYRKRMKPLLKSHSKTKNFYFTMDGFFNDWPKKDMRIRDKGDKNLEGGIDLVGVYTFLDPDRLYIGFLPRVQVDESAIEKQSWLYGNEYRLQIDIDMDGKAEFEVATQGYRIWYWDLRGGTRMIKQSPKAFAQMFAGVEAMIPLDFIDRPTPAKMNMRASSWKDDKLVNPWTQWSTAGRMD